MRYYPHFLSNKCENKMNLIKEKSVALGVLLIPVAGQLNANNYQNYNNYSNDSNYSNYPNQEARKEDRQEGESSKTYCKDPQSNYLIRGDFLYWIPQVSGLEVNFGSNSVYQSTVNSVSETTSIEQDSDVHFDWDVGYRVGVGYQFDHNRWETNATWTHFQGSGYRSVNHGNWHVRLDQLDTVVVYSAPFNPSFTLRPLIGIRASEIRQKLYSRVVINVDIEDVGLATDTKTFQDRQKFYGIGPIFGFNSDVKIGCGFGVYGNAAVSLQYGTYHLSFNDQEVITEPATPSQIVSSLKKQMYAFDFNVDLALGVQWQTLVYDRVYITMKLGLENLQYFDQSRLGANWGKLSFSGGVFSFILEF